MENHSIRALLERLIKGEIGIEQSLQTLKDFPYETIDIAKVDHHRALRRGFPEVIFGEGKTPDDLARIYQSLSNRHQTVLCTRVNEQQVKTVKKVVHNCTYDHIAKALFTEPEEIINRGRGKICVVAAGTLDRPIAQEALLTAHLMGNETDCILDVGVAGIHRLFGELKRIQEAEVVIVVAGMEGALPSVLGGLIEQPIIAVPTSIGYGAGAGGIAALLTMLNSCVPGITVVNIDNGFGAGYSASLINRDHRHSQKIKKEPISKQSYRTDLKRNETTD